MQTITYGLTHWCNYRRVAIQRLIMTYAVPSLEMAVEPRKGVFLHRSVKLVSA